MHIRNGKDATALCGEVYKIWSDFRGSISLAEMRIINKIFWYFDNNQNCGHKELVADLNIPSSALSKLLKSWLTEGQICTKKSGNDKRRNFYYPSPDLVKLREENYNIIKSSINNK